MFRGKKIVAIIPARSGSKRIKNKNIIRFKGEPMIAKTLKIAKKCKYIDKVVISTDSQKILDISKKYGVKTPFLRKSAFDDKSSVQEATILALKQTENFYTNFDIVIQLMPNCPNRKIKTLNSSIEHFFKSKKKSQISFFEYGFANPWWAHRIKGKNIRPISKRNIFTRSQDLEKLYCPTGSIWISYVSTLKKYKTFYSPNYGYFLINFEEAIDIDTYEDLAIAKKI
jgi:CMP-N-acetylneuraminic acid synthetase